MQCALQEKDKPNSTTMNGSPGSTGMGEQMGVKIEPAEAESLSVSGSSGILTPINPYTCVKPISPEQEELINRLVSFQCEFEQPSEEDLKRITNQPMEGESPSDYSFRHITEITILTVQLIVEFSKRLPGFNELLREDQITLLKACSSEVMMLRMARKYDVQSDSIIFANNQSYTRDSYSVAGMGDTIEDLLRFCRQMYAMRVNNAEYALLTAIVIFSVDTDFNLHYKIHINFDQCTSVDGTMCKIPHEFFWLFDKHQYNLTIQKETQFVGKQKGGEASGDLFEDIKGICG
ncbi:Uncharacterized protein DBV15_12450 [Temnothorax longispinosus]|uniref:NR LBD domain-containing protein n=1 Tax=Temnothorax longispinosus TaxID=300112 RepID=A0A4V3SBV0_9HYME|nr:Uncharacterized protein DBV15_12450 [Temnothorax longispinosus]